MQLAKEMLENLDNLSIGRYWTLDEVFPVIIDSIRNAGSALQEVNDAELEIDNLQDEVEKLKEQVEELELKIEELEGVNDHGES